MSNWNKNEEGATLVFVGVCLAVLLGFAALTFDLGRVAATQSDMQGYADQVALAAAGELDGKPDAITRATIAAEELINDRQTFADGEQALGGAADFTLRFLNGLPDADRPYFDGTDDLTGFETTDPREATLVEVTTTQRSVFLPFFRAFAVLNGTDPRDGLVGARAVAGFTQYACDVTTLMFCLPSDEPYKADQNIGDTILLRSGGSGSAWGPGDFGFVDPSSFAVDPNGPCAGLSGVNLDACLIAASGNRTRCFAQRGIDIEPGQKVGIENSVFNTRFDIFSGIMSNKRNDRNYAPGPHVVKGLTSNSGGQCLSNSTEPSPDTMAFPPDDCMEGNSCTKGGGRFGNSEWNNGRVKYENTNYGDPENTYAPLGEIDFNGDGKKTRFDYYQAEIERARLNNGKILKGRSEDGSPQCSAHKVDDVNRRVFIAAAVDCSANPINGAATNIPVEEYFEVFLMRPVGEGSGSPATFDLYVEVIGSAGGDGAGNADDAGIFRNIVELYR